ncbi:MAG: endonuclease domain-containing protein [Alcanivorax sp.]|nr:endonuclease domain-containing protein [Alcanivorax sp.]
MGDSPGTFFIMPRIFNRVSGKRRRQALRSNMPGPERYLWQRLRAGQLGVKFRRQHGIGEFIVDFYCPGKRLVVEIDGDSHYQPGSAQHDAIRTAFLEACGCTVKRYTNQDVMQNLGGVLDDIRCTLASLPACTAKTR